MVDGLLWACRKAANGRRSEWKNRIAYVENQGPERSEMGHGLRVLFEGMLPLTAMVLQGSATSQ